MDRVGLVAAAMVMVVAMGSDALAVEPGGAKLAVQGSGQIAPGEMEPWQSAFNERLAPFAEGTWTVQAYGSALVGDSDKGGMYAGHIGGGYFFKDAWSVNLEALGGAVRSETDADENGGVGGLDLMVRWHFLRRSGWSLYADAGAGVQQATTDFPSDNRFNFRLQTGIGVTRRIAGNAHLMGGARYQHISNAGITDGNDGYDGAQLYAGLMFPF